MQPVLERTGKLEGLIMKKAKKYSVERKPEK
jgi:hypothetical protein